MRKFLCGFACGLLSVVVAIQSVALVKNLRPTTAHVSLHSILQINSLTVKQLLGVTDPSLTSRRSFPAEVAAVRPDGSLVIEAKKCYRQDRDKIIHSYLLTGTVRPADVKPNWTVLGQDVADLKIETHSEDPTPKWPSLSFDPGSVCRRIVDQFGLSE